MEAVSTIASEGVQIDSLKHLLQNCGVNTHVYHNLDAWVDESSGHHQAYKGLSENSNGADDAKLVNCVLLVGPPAELARRRMPERINQIQPGVPVVVAGEAPEHDEVVQLVQQGAMDVVDLRQPEQLCTRLRSATSRGLETQPERRRVLELRRRLATLTAAERQVLDAMMDGHANKETAKLLGIGLRTVELRRAKIMTKMGARGVAELIRLFCEARCPGGNFKALEN
ncbi:MAG: hypothetical protein KDA37_15150 [Planctomycetales bacterium]|nr:hypothetical protein [Planctomycetales bacterium]